MCVCVCPSLKERQIRQLVNHESRFFNQWSMNSLSALWGKSLNKGHTLTHTHHSPLPPYLPRYINDSPSSRWQSGRTRPTESIKASYFLTNTLLVDKMTSICGLTDVSGERDVFHRKIKNNGLWERRPGPATDQTKINTRGGRAAEWRAGRSKLILNIDTFSRLINLVAWLDCPHITGRARLSAMRERQKEAKGGHKETGKD